MTKYLDEYIPNSKQKSRQVQSDGEKLKFLNVLSCAAIVVVPVGSTTMTGVHLSITTSKDTKEGKAELKQVLGELQVAAGAGPLDAYIICSWGFHRQGGLGKGLKKIARAVYLCDVPIDKVDANVDVMVKMLGTRLQASLRQKAEKVLDERGQAKMKPGYNYKTAEPGKPGWETDSDSKPWSPVPFTRLL